MFEWTTVLKVLPSAVSLLTQGASKHEQKCAAYLELLKKDNKNLISFAQKSLIMAEKMKEDKKSVRDFYESSRKSYDMLDEFITYHRYAVTKPGEKPEEGTTSKTLKWLDEIKSSIFPDAEKLEPKMEEVINSYLELNNEIRNLIYNSRNTIRKDNKDHPNSILEEKYIIDLRKACVDITNIVIEFYAPGKNEQNK
ncbi:hypothetical protein HMPREF3050_04130 [Neisseria sp. HMSC065D04]|jgi:hypothetical protein|uniref:hypothetical protein n=1 Tax=Neisseria sp. HMSC065D04 TaxID=1739542 RepID=UPI0008A143C7|nr:hypothetical protein [Neisseria sp. HMSC065D04]OFO34323.1 hypothetical protein HMPREF3050_04130 [Neisseria sp. HMSC065D04]